MYSSPRTLVPFPHSQPDFSIRNNAELLALLRRYSPRGGMLVKKLQESWPNAKHAIEELERDGKVMVLRTGGNAEREGQMKMVFWDEMGSMPKIDEGERDPLHSCGRECVFGAN